MARKIFGIVRDEAGKPLAGACIKAWDEDLGEDDFMGETITDQNGHYEISYHDGLWETAPRNTNSQRPDIYITVSIRNAINAWVIIGRSRTFKDHKLSDDLPIDMNITLGRPVCKHTAFDPLVHGFHFGNSFKLTVDLLGLKLGKWNMGFCGGMCAGALHRFNRNSPVPPDTNPPVQGTELYTELLNRQITSLTNVIFDIYNWQSASDETFRYRKHGIGFRTKKQWPLLKEELDAGRPAILVIIRSNGYFANPTDNHQVVATGYEYNPATGDLKVYLYDPNWPSNRTFFTVHCGLPNDRINAIYSTGEAIRGFFINPNTQAASK